MGPKKQVVYARRTALQWERLITRQAEGTLSQRAFCAEQGLSYGSFCHWKRRLRDECAGGGEPGGFVELPVAASQRAQWDVELTLGEGVVLRVRCG
jgi:hypothetical protein